MAKKRRSKAQAGTSNTNGPKTARKKSRLNPSTSNSNTDILTNLGLTNNHISPLRKTTTLLDRPEVTQPVKINKLIQYLL